jgi:hypothetical protein
MGVAVLSAGAIVGVDSVVNGTARPTPTPDGSVLALRADEQTEELWQQAKEYARQQHRVEARAAAAAAVEAERLAAEQAAAEQVAAEQAAVEQAAAEAARQEETARAARSRPETTEDVAVDVEPGSAQAIAAEMVAARGWGSDQFDCLVNLWERESGWRVDAENSSSGAYGIPQALPGSKMASAGDDWRTNPATQITWGLGYIEDRYGDPCGAWNHFLDRNWY